MKKRFLSLSAVSVLAVTCALACAFLTGCGKETAASKEDTAPAVSPAPTAAQAPVPVELYAVTPAPEAEPTPVPTPEIPRCDGVYADGEGLFTLSLDEGGTWTALDHGRKTKAEGTYTYDGEKLALSFEGRSVSLSVHRSGDGLSLKNGEDEIQLTQIAASGQGNGYGTPLTEESRTWPMPFYAVTEGATVTVCVSDGRPAAQYLFSSIEKTPSADSKDWLDCNAARFSVFKVDGTYYLYLRDASGTVSGPCRITVDSGFRYVTWGKGLTAITEPLSDFLAARGDSVEQMNRTITNNIMASGFQTRAGVLTSGVSLISYMAQYDAAIRYQGQGSYQKEENWGVNPEWGAKLAHPTTDGNGTYKYCGMQCVASVVWAYKQAGINISNPVGAHIGTLGERTRSGDNRIKYYQAKGGDICQVDAHYLMIVDRIDTDSDGEADSFMTYEMNSPNLALLVLTFRQVRGRDFFNMDSVFENEGRRRKDSRFWEDTYFIPTEAMPEYLKEAVQLQKEREPLYRLAEKLLLR